MTSSSLPSERVAVDEAAADQGYALWKRSKIERAKAQALDRDAMIPAEKVWREVGLED